MSSALCMRREWPRCSAAIQRLQDRRLDLEVIARVQKASDRAIMRERAMNSARTSG